MHLSVFISFKPIEGRWFLQCFLGFRKLICILLPVTSTREKNRAVIFNAGNPKWKSQTPAMPRPPPWGGERRGRRLLELVHLWGCSHLQPGRQGAPGGGMGQLWGSLCIPKLSSLNIQGREHALGAPQAKPSLNEQLAWALITLTNATHPSTSKKQVILSQTSILTLTWRLPLSICVWKDSGSSLVPLIAAISSGSHLGLLLSCHANACTALQLAKSSCLLQCFP